MHGHRHGELTGEEAKVDIVINRLNEGVLVLSVQIFADDLSSFVSSTVILSKVTLYLPVYLNVYRMLNFSVAFICPLAHMLFYLVLKNP